MNTYYGSALNSGVVIEGTGCPTTAAVVIQADSEAEARLKLKTWHKIQDCLNELVTQTGHFYCGHTCNCPHWQQQLKIDLRNSAKICGE